MFKEHNKKKFKNQKMEAITMNNIKLTKQTKPDFEELEQMLSDLDKFYNSEVKFNDKEWIKNLNAIIDFQDDDGSFNLFETYNIPNDAKIDFCYMPTYLCTATLMKAFLSKPEAFTPKQKNGLLKGLKMSSTKNLWGHGYEGLKYQINALNIFMKAGLNEFMDLYSEYCPEFSEMIEKIKTQFNEMEAQGKFLGPWGENYEDEIKSINKYFCQRLVFVYGTLMNGEINNHYLENSTCLGPATINGYDMYNVGWYPAIIPGNNIIIGELYQIPIEDMHSIDTLEGEGSLYKKKCEKTTTADGKNLLALVYIYMEDTMNYKKISTWKKDYIWYVSYGSNMLKERFMCYIEGGSYEGSRYHTACEDTTPPLAVKPFNIPYDMYFGNESGSWHGSGVSFLDTTKKGKALGVAYLISKEQFEHVIKRENAGRTPEPGNNWYEDIINIGIMDGFEVKTITNNNIRPYNEPSTEYLDTLHNGINENWPEMTEKEIEDYLNNCIRND